MSSPNERFAEIELNYKSALQNEPGDLARATTPAAITAIQANVASARATYYTAVDAQLTESGSAVEIAYEAAQKANRSVDEARAQSAEIPTLISKLTLASKAADNLLNAAKKA